MVWETQVALNSDKGAEAASKESPRRAKSILGMCGGAHFVHDGLHDSLYILLPLWSQAFGLSLTQVGILKFAYSGAMAVFQVPAGFLAERYSPRLLLAVGTTILGIAFLLLGLAGFFWVRDGSIFKALEQIVQVPGEEMSVDHVFKHVVEAGLHVMRFDVAHYVHLGTAEELLEYRYWSEREHLFPPEPMPGAAPNAAGRGQP